MKRFKVGDLARYVVSVGMDQSLIGQIVEITRVGPIDGYFHNGADAQPSTFDYAIYNELMICPGGCWDWQLAPLNPPAEPISLTRQEEFTA